MRILQLVIKSNRQNKTLKTCTKIS